MSGCKMGASQPDMKSSDSDPKNPGPDPQYRKSTLLDTENRHYKVMQGGQSRPLRLPTVLVLGWDAEAKGKVCHAHRTQDTKQTRVIGDTGAENLRAKTIDF